EKPEMTNARVLRDLEQRVPDQDQRQLARRIAQVTLEVFEELVTTFVLIDPPDIDRKWPADVVLLPEPRRLRVVGHVRSDVDNDPGNILVAGHGVNHRPFLRR